MESGILYVVFNKWISDPKTNKMPYKIGITKSSVSDRYYGLGLKMPGKFETRFAYRIENYEEAEKAIGIIFKNDNINGEWYDLNEEDISLIEKNCKKLNGELITDKVNQEIETETEMETTNELSKNKAINICRLKEIDMNGNITFASKNRGVDVYWANPDINFLTSDWWLLLNDYINNKLYVFHIPSNSINRNQMSVKGNNTDIIDLQINYNDKDFTDTKSGLIFSTWLIRTIDY